MSAYLKNNIVSNTTTTVCTTAGILHTIVVNTTAAGSIIVYDGPAAAGNTIATLKSSVGEGTYQYDVVFSNSLVIVTAASPDVTVSYALAGA